MRRTVSVDQVQQVLRARVCRNCKSAIPVGRGFPSKPIRRSTARPGVSCSTTCPSSPRLLASIRCCGLTTWRSAGA